MRTILCLFFTLIALTFYVSASPPFGQPKNPIKKGKKQIVPNVSEVEIAQEVLRQMNAVALLRSNVPADKAFQGWHFVISPGHGDKEPGAIRTEYHVDGSEVLYGESVMTLDIARRLGWYLKRRGASGVYFNLGPPEIVNLNAQDEYAFWHPAKPPLLLMTLKTLLPAHPSAYTDDMMALSARSQVANQKVKTYGSERVIYISVHIDSVSSKISGMSFYQARGGKSKLILTLKEVAVQKGLVRVKEGHKGSYLAIQEQNFLEITPEFNNAGEALLIETGNIHNGDFTKGDFKRLIAAQGREEIAQVIGLGLQKYCEKYPLKN